MNLAGSLSIHSINISLLTFIARRSLLSDLLHCLRPCRYRIFFLNHSLFIFQIKLQITFLYKLWDNVFFMIHFKSSYQKIKNTIYFYFCGARSFLAQSFKMKARGDVR